MGLYSYSNKVADEKTVGRAQVHDVNASYKDLSQVLAAIKGKGLKEAVTVLEDTVQEKKPIPYRRFAKRLGHRRELGGKKGRYPKKEAKICLALLKNAAANAEAKGLDRDRLYISAAASHKQNTFMRYRKYWASGIIIGYGKQSYASKYVTCWAEVTLAEKTEKPGKDVEKAKTGKKLEDKKAKSEAQVEKVKQEKKAEHKQEKKKEENGERKLQLIEATA